MNKPELVLNLVSGCFLILILLNLSILLYVAFFKLEKIEQRFTRSRRVGINRKFLGSDPIGRLYRLSQISGLISRPKRCHHEDPSANDDVIGLPRHLRNWFQIPSISLNWLMGGWVALWIVRYVMESAVR
jgi:hypothetical protein